MPVSQNSAGTTWIVTLDADASAERVWRAIQRAGLSIQEFLQPTSIFIVRGTEAQAEKARQVGGVAAVEAARPTNQ